MKNKIIIDNALAPNDCEALYNHMMSMDFTWSFNPGIIKGDDEDYQFVHGIHSGYHMTSPHNYRQVPHFNANEMFNNLIFFKKSRGYSGDVELKVG